VNNIVKETSPSTVSGLFLVSGDNSKRFLIFPNNEVVEYVVCDERTLFKSSDLFTFLFSKDAPTATRGEKFSECPPGLKRV
jgi:hypothetical protein